MPPWEHEDHMNRYKRIAARLLVGSLAGSIVLFGCLGYVLVHNIHSCQF